MFADFVSLGDKIELRRLELDEEEVQGGAGSQAVEESPEEAEDLEERELLGRTQQERYEAWERRREERLEELEKLREQDKPRDGSRKIHYCSLYDTLAEDMLEITMPMERTKLIVLPLESEYDMIFYTKNGLFQCQGQIVDRYKVNNIYLLAVKVLSTLRKCQRREFYRFSCALKMSARNLAQNELQALEANRSFALSKALPLRHSVLLDISGGGLRFISSQRYEAESFLYITFSLLQGDTAKEYEAVGKILSVRELDNRPGVWEHRVQYYDMDEDTREEIIKYIFEEERKLRRKKTAT